MLNSGQKRSDWNPIYICSPDALCSTRKNRNWCKRKGSYRKAQCCFFVCTIFDSFLNDFAISRQIQISWHPGKSRLVLLFCAFILRNSYYEFATSSKNSVQKLALSTFSSLMKQDFQEDAVSRGREFLLIMLLYRKICKMCSSGQGSLAQSCSAGTRK